MGQGVQVGISFMQIPIRVVLIPCLIPFSQFDLYTKSAKIPNIEELKPYYQGLVDKYIPGTIKF